MKFIHFALIGALLPSLSYGSSSSSSSNSDVQNDQAFIAWAKTLPMIKLTKDDLAEAFVDNTIEKDGRTWTMGRVQDYDAMRDLVLNPDTKILEIGDQSDQMHAPIFEIDSEYNHRRPVMLLNEELVDDEGFCATLPIPFTTLLTAEERANPLVEAYRMSVNFTQHHEDSTSKDPQRKARYKANMILNIKAIMRLTTKEEDRKEAQQELDEYIQNG